MHRAVIALCVALWACAAQAQSNRAATSEEVLDLFFQTCLDAALKSDVIRDAIPNPFSQEYPTVRESYLHSAFHAVGFSDDFRKRGRGYSLCMFNAQVQEADAFLNAFYARMQMDFAGRLQARTSKRSRNVRQQVGLVLTALGRPIFVDAGVYKPRVTRKRNGINVFVTLNVSHKT